MALTAMQRNRRKLADIFDRTIPGEPIVQIGNYADIHARVPRLLYDVFHKAALTWARDKNLVHEVLARQ